MRRSKAPSMRQAVKREADNPDPLEEPQSSCSWPSISLPSEWGSSKGTENLGPRELKAGENPLKESRIFHVLWRNQTTKKHKTWTGNGTLVVTGSIVTLKDDTGKVVDTMTVFKQRDFKENDQLQVGTRDVEVQEEIKTLEECVIQRKLEIATWCQKIDALNGHSDTSPPPAPSAPFRSHVLKKIKCEGNFTDVENPSTWGSSHLDASPHVGTAPCLSNELEWGINKRTSAEKENPATSEFTRAEYLCFLAPAALQESILLFLAKYIKKSKVDPPFIDEMVQVVCDHPVLLKTLFKNTHFMELMEVLEPNLPPWPEMGLYDSAKFEFVHAMLDNLVLEKKVKCCVLANSQDCLRLVIGYCQSYDIDQAELDSPQKIAVFNSTEKPMVGLVLTSNLPENNSLRCKHLIIYNHNAREEATQLLALREMDTKEYTLITSGGGPEELQFYRRLGLITDNDSLGDLQNYGGKLMPSTIYELASWKKIEPPFGNNFLEESSISDSLDCLQLVYSRKTKIITKNDLNDSHLKT